MILKRSMVQQALAQACWNPAASVILDDYQPVDFLSDTCFAVVFNRPNDRLRFLVKLAFLLADEDPERGEQAATGIVSVACENGPIMYFPGVELED